MGTLIFIMKKYAIYVVMLSMAFICSLSGQDIENKIHYGKRILDALIDIVQGVSFIECTEECFSRRRCLSVNYWRSILLCEMNSVDASSHLLSDELRTVFADISLWEQHFVGGCRNHKCAINMKCVPGPFGTHRCEIADCGPLPTLRDAIEIKSKGQFLTIGVGSLRIFQCYPWTHEKKYRQKVICRSDGNWTHYQNTPCNFVTCATELTSLETLEIDNKEVGVPYVYSEGHKWAVIQRMCFNNTNFYRNWSDYKAGFGNFKEKSDFWIGNDVIHMLTKNGYNYMKVEMLKTDNGSLQAEYSHFFVGDESTKYNLTLRGFKGLYDCMTNKTDKRGDANGMKFSKSDVDNDQRKGVCADLCQSGWWFHSCTCGNLIGLFGNEKRGFVMRWMCKDGWDCPLKATRILLRPQK